MGEITVWTLCSPINQSVFIILRQYLMKVETKECNDSMIWSKMKESQKRKKLASHPGIKGTERWLSLECQQCVRLFANRQKEQLTIQQRMDGVNKRKWCHDQYLPLEGAPAFVLDSDSTATCSLRSPSGRPFNTAAPAQCHFTHFLCTSTVGTM